jgi:hypothetical protein
MAHLAEPHDAAPGAADDRAPGEGELASLVRRWVGVRRSGAAVRVAQAPATAPVRSESEPVPEPVPEPVLEPVPESGPATEAPLAMRSVARAEASGERAPRIPALPSRPTAEDTEHATRLAVLIDARRVSEDVAAGLLTRLGDRGSVNVCRAYADWRRSDLGTWVERLRRQGLHSFHQFGDGDDQALVALAIDAVDIAREASVDEVVLAGDMTSMLPLVHRLHGAGVRVVVVGPAHTPHDVRAACDEFLDEDSLLGEPAAPAGRHRA